MRFFDSLDKKLKSKLPSNVSVEQAFTPLGFYLAWCAERALLSAERMQKSSIGLELLLEGQITGREFFLDFWEDVFGPEDLEPFAAAYTESYYLSEGISEPSYFQDFVQVLCPLSLDVYAVEDSWENYALLKGLLDARFKEWKSTN